MSRTLRGLAAALAVVAAGAALPLPPASAGSGGFTDPDDAGAPDVRRVAIKNDSPRQIRVVVRYDGGLADVARVYVDTRPGDPGPEFLLDQSIDSSGAERRFSVHRVERWGDDPTAGNTVCSLRSRPGRRGGDDKMSYPVPRSCLGDAGTVRVAVLGFDRTGGRDWAPRARHFGLSIEQS